MFDTDAVVIGAGAVGLACAAELAVTGLSVIVLERADAIGTQTSSRNSEVIHAGMYYETGSLKHRFCVAGRRLLYPFLEIHWIAHRRCGKLIVATSDGERGQIEEIYRRGFENGVEDLVLLSGPEAMAMEPALSCVSAIWSPQTGIFDSHGFMVALQGRLEDNGGAIAFCTEIVRAAPLAGGGFEIEVQPEARITAQRLINCAGLYAQEVARRIEGVPNSAIPKLVLAKGSYFSFSGRPAFTRLIYPAPVAGGLGVHITLDLAGQLRLGPDVEWLGHQDPGLVDYNVDQACAEAFVEAVRRYWPGLPKGSLAPAYAGCRPKLSGPGEPAADFRIDGPEVHGIDGLVNLSGIESPGLTAALAIAKRVKEIVSCDV